MSDKNKKQLNNIGFTLIEVMAAVAVLSIGLIGSLTVITKNLSSISAGEDRIIAANLAAEGIELVRNVRDTNWLTPGNIWRYNIEGTNPSNEAVRFFCGNSASVFKITPLPTGIDDTTRCSGNSGGNTENCRIYIYTDGTGNRCYSDNFNDRADSTGYSATPTNFFRFIKVTRITDDSLEIKVDVKWILGSQSNKVTATEVLYNWK